MFEKLIVKFHENGYHLFKTRANKSWGYYAVSYKDIKDGKFDMINAKYISGSIGGCKDSILIM